MKTKRCGWWILALATWLSVLHADAATIRMVGGEWQMDSHIIATNFVVESGAQLGGTGTVHSAAMIRGVVSPGSQPTDAATLSFSGELVFDGGRYPCYAASSDTLDLLAVAGKVSGVGTVEISRATGAFPDRQVIVEGAAASDYASIAASPEAGWYLGQSGTLDLWIGVEPGMQILGTNGADVASGEAADLGKGTKFYPAVEGAVVTNTLSLTNDGYAVLDLTHVQTNGTDSDIFAVSDLPASVPIGGVVDFTVTYSPTELGHHSASLVVSNNSPDSPYTINLAGSCYYISTNNGPYVGGNEVTILNGNFGSITNVLVGGVTATMEDSGGSWLILTIPETGAAGLKDILIQTSDNGETAIPDAYMVNPAGTVIDVDPSSGPWTGNFPVVISGTNLGNGADITNVTFYGTSVASIDSQSATQIVVTAAAVPSPRSGAIRIYSTSHGVTAPPFAFSYTRDTQADLVFTPASPQTFGTTNGLSTSGGSGTGAVSYVVVSGPGQITGGSNLTVTAGSGTIEVIATKAQDDLYLETSVTGLVAAAKADQAITFPVIADQETTNQVELAASADSGLAVSFAVATGPAVIAGGTNLSFTGEGSVSIVASQAGDGDWNAASDVTNVFNVTKAVALVFLQDLAQTYDGTARTATATTMPAGLMVEFTYDGATTAPSNTGTYAITGTVDDVMYQGVETGSLVVAKADQSIAFPAIDFQFAPDTVELAATADSGLVVSFAVGSGPASIADGTNLTFSTSGTVSIVASQAGDANWNPALDVTNTFDVVKGEAGVFLLDLEQTYDGTARTITATTMPAGLTVEFTYDGNAWAPTNTGTYAVTGTIDDPRYEGSAADSLVVKTGQTITFPAIADQETTNQVGLAATADSGLTVSFAVASGPALIIGGTNLSFTGEGSVSIVASQAGDGDWSAAPDVTNTFNVTKAVASVFLLDLEQTYDGTARTITATTMPVGLTVEFTYDGSATAPSNAGTVAVTGTVSDAMYQGVETGSLVVAKADQAIDFPAISDQLTIHTVGLAATADSGLAVSFTVAAGPASIAGETNLTFSTSGTVSIAASQAGDANWNAALDVTNTFNVTKAVAPVFLQALAQTYDGTARTVTATTMPAGLTVEFTYDGNAWAPTNAGSTAVTGTVNDLMYQGMASDILVVARALDTITFGDTNQAYTGEAREVTATAGSGSPVAITYEGVATAPSNVGTYAVTGVVDTVNWSATNTATLTIAKGDQAITFPAIADQVTTDVVHLSATGGGSGLPVGFTVFSGPGVIADSTNLSFTGTGTVSIVASQAGDASWNPAPDVTNSFVVRVPLEVVLSAADINVRENGEGRFFVRLNRQPLSNLVVAVNYFQGSASMTVQERASMVFRPDNWNVWLRVTLAQGDDANANGEMALFKVSSPEVGNRYVVARALDDDIGENVALATSGTTISRTTVSGVDHAIDGIHTVKTNVASVWAVDPPGTMTLDLKVPVSLDRVRLLNYDWSYRVHRYQIDTSLDGTNWTLLADASQTDRHGWDDWPAEEVTARYLRFTGLSNSVNSAVCISEWEVYGYRTAPNLPQPVLSTSNVNVREGGEGRFFVRLSKAPEQNVLVTVRRTGDDTNLTVKGHTALYFTPTRWNEWKPFTLAAALDDNDVGEAVEFQVSASVVSETLTAHVLDGDIGDNVALASAGTTISGVNAATVERAIDGIHDTKANYAYTVWTAEPPGTMTLDLQAPTEVSRVRLLTSDWSYRVYRYLIESSSDGTNWTVLVDASGTDRQGWDDWSVADVTMRYVRFTGLSNSVNPAVCVAEWEVYETPPPPPGPQSRSQSVVVESQPVSVLTSDGLEDESGWAAVDGDERTAWVGQKVGGGYLLIEYQPALQLQDLEVVMAGDSLTHVEYLYSSDAQEWEPLPEDMDRKAVSLNFLWLLFPDDGSLAVPHVLEIHPNP